MAKPQNAGIMKHLISFLLAILLPAFIFAQSVSVKKEEAKKVIDKIEEHPVEIIDVKVW